MRFVICNSVRLSVNVRMDGIGLSADEGSAVYVATSIPVKDVHAALYAE